MSARIVKKYLLRMEMPIVSIVVMNVILQTDLEVELMNKKDFRNERLYQTTMSAVKNLLKQGTISKEEYGQIDTIFREKYRPSLGSLLFDINLIQIE